MAFPALAATSDYVARPAMSVRARRAPVDLTPVLEAVTHDWGPGRINPENCWVRSWVGNAMAEEVIHGTVEVEFPVHCQWTGDGLEAHVNGPAKVLP